MGLKCPLVLHTPLLNSILVKGLYKKFTGPGWPFSTAVDLTNEVDTVVAGVYRCGNLGKRVIFANHWKLQT